MSEDIQERYDNERQLIKEDDKFYAAKIRSLENRRHAETEALEAFKRKEKKHHQKKDFILIRIGYMLQIKTIKLKV